MSEPLFLAGDVGGTKTLLRLLGSDGRTIQSARYESAKFPDLSVIVQQFFSGARGVADASNAARDGEAVRPRVAVFGVAGPVVEGAVRTTNLPWQLDEKLLAQRCGLETVRLLNDFEATAWGVLTLPPESLHTLQRGHARTNGAMAVIGAGTGLGEALLVWTGSDYLVVPTEGGHADFAPRDDVEIELLRYLRLRYGRVSWERVVSGRGIVNIYEFLRDTGVVKESPTIAKELADSDPPAVIGRHALAGDDALCLRAVDLFVASYGAEAGNLALKGLATGGVYITGGVAPKLLSRLEDGAFLRTYRDKGRLSELVERAPVHVVLDQEAALHGAAYVARRLAAAR